MPPILRITATACSISLGCSASAQTPASPETAGFWSYPDSAKLTPEALGALCETGFSLVFDDGTRHSYLRVDTDTGQALWLDSVMRCTPEGADTASCTGWVDDGDGAQNQSFTNLYSVSDGSLRLETRLDGGAVFVTWPQPCPASAIRDALALGVIPAE